jgi:putative oxidoreductase
MLQLDTAPSVSTVQSPAFRRPITRVDRPATVGRPLASQLRERLNSAEARLERAELAIHEWLVLYSMAILRVSLGSIFLGFGALKLLGVSPAANLVEATTHAMFLGLVPGPIALVGVGLLECTIGILLIAGKGMRVAMYMLAGQLVGILSPVVLLSTRLFSGSHNAPTLEGQYVLKDVVLVAAAMVIATTLRGGRLTTAADSADVEMERSIGSAQRSQHA